MIKRTNRLCIYPKDVQCITGKSLRHARELLKKVKADLGKNKNDLLTFQEFCSYTGIPYEFVKEIIRD